MTFLHVLTEEPSMKIVLDALLPKLLPTNMYFRVYPHQGKQNLEKALRSTVPTLSRIPNSRILIVRDKDGHDCLKLKQELVNIMTLTCQSPYRVRIVCRELEAWYLGDVDAIEQAYPRFKADNHRNKQLFRDVDSIGNPVQILLQQVPDYKDRAHLPKLEIAERIAPHLAIERNQSVSFQQFVRAVQQLISPATR
jgi:hypothetical protein